LNALVTDVAISPRPTVGLYFVSGARKSYNIAKTLALGGCRVIVRIEKPRAQLMDPANPFHVDWQYCAFLYDDADIEIVPHVSKAPPLDAVLYESCLAAPQFPDELASWISTAPKVASWNSSWHEADALRNLRSELTILWRYRRVLPSTDAVVMHNGRIRMRPTALFSRPHIQGAFVHPLYLFRPDYREAMFGTPWRPETRRAARVLFSGDAGSPRRRALVAEIGAWLDRRPGVRMHRSYDACAEATKDAPDGSALDIFWLATLPGQTQMIPMLQWPAMLRACDFCFCPPGYEQKSHRVVECLLQGAIPVVHCPEEYDLGLVDGENCIVVRRGDWRRGVEWALTASPDHVLRMRKAVGRLARDHLHERGMAQRWLRYMGLEREAAALPAPAAPEAFVGEARAVR
jgi:hypothetical protein